MSCLWFYFFFCYSPQLESPEIFGLQISLRFQNETIPYPDRYNVLLSKTHLVFYSLIHSLIQSPLSSICHVLHNVMGFPCDSAGKESSCKCGRPGFDPWVGKIAWRREMLPTPEFWLREFHGLQSTESKRVGHDWATFTQCDKLKTIIILGDNTKI